MASVSEMRPSAEQRERLFFLVMALAIAASVAIAFGLWLYVGNSTFAAPWWVHVHAVSFVTWIAFYLLQNALVLRDEIGLHRKLGRIGAGYAVWMVLVGLVLTPLTLAVGRSPPFFAPAFFLALDWINIAAFGALVFAAIVNRKRTDWHRRLMLCATISVIAPAWGRLILLSGAQMTVWNNTGALLAYVIVAMLFDAANRGRVHPAYVWGFGTLVGMAGAIELIAGFAPFVALADRIAG